MLLLLHIALRELGFQFLGLEERPLITRILVQDSFEKLFNIAYAGK